MTVPVEVIDDLQFLGGIFQGVENDFNGLDYEKPLQSYLPSLVKSHGDFFSSRVDPNGSQWPPLAAYTIKKKGHDVPLVETGAMKSSVLEKGADHIEAVSHRGLLFGTKDEKAVYHQFGTNRIPQRAFIGMQTEQVDEVAGIVADHAVEGLKFKA